MNSYNYSYNVLINRLEAFAAGHLLIKRFTHGQIDLADMDQNEQYPFMHVVPNNIKPVDGGMQFDFQILFADIPRDKETKAEYQREVISAWDWSACDIPAVWAVGGSSSGGSGSPVGIVLRTNGVDNAVQNILDLVAGTNITITDNGDGSVTFDASGGGGGGTVYVSTEFNVNHTTATGNQYVIGDRVWYNGNVYACIANNDAILPTNAAYWTLQGSGFRLRQTPVDWNATSGDYQILNKPTIPSAQGLQDVITTDPVLTTDNTIDCNTYGLNITDTSNFEVNSTSKLNLDVNGTASFGIDTNSVTSQKVTGTVQTQVIVDTTKAAIAATDSSVSNTTSLSMLPNSVRLITPNVNDTTATVGQVLTLSNAGTGEVEFTTVGGGSGTVTSVGLTMPAPTNAAFSVAGSPVTTSGTLAVTANGTTDQYIDGTGALRTLPSTGGGGGQIFYFNGNVSQGTIGGNDYYELGTAANTGPAANFTRATTGAIARFITDVNEPNHVLIPSGVWTIDVYLSETGGGSNHAQILAKLYTYNGSTFTLVATSTMEEITNGNVPDLYSFTISVPNTVTAATDRIHIEFDIQNTNGKTVTLYTEDGRIGEVHTTYAIGLSSLNGLTANTQNFATGTAGTDFGISSVGSTHTFNLPTASAANRGALSSADWSTFNGKQNSIGLTTVGTNLATLPNPSAIRYLRINADNTISALTLAELKTDIGVGSSVVTANVVNVGIGFEDITGLSFAVTANKTYKWRATISYAVTGGAQVTFSSNGPTSSINNARYTTSFNVTQNALTNQAAYDSGANATVQANGLSTSDGIVRVTANGTFTLRMRCATAGALTVRAGSIIEFEEVL